MSEYVSSTAAVSDASDGGGEPRLSLGVDVCSPEKEELGHFLVTTADSVMQRRPTAQARC